MSIKSLPVTSSDHVTVMHPTPEPQATFAVIERTMVATSALLRDLLNDPDFSETTRQRWGSQMEMRRDELQTGVIRLAREAGKERKA